MIFKIRHKREDFVNRAVDDNAFLYINHLNTSYSCSAVLKLYDHFNILTTTKTPVDLSSQARVSAFFIVMICPGSGLTSSCKVLGCDMLVWQSLHDSCHRGC